MRKLLLLLSMILIVVSCDQPGCEGMQNNPVLNSAASDSELYQNELVKLLRQDSDNVKYYFDEKSEQNGMDFWYINVYGTDFCGKLKLFVDTEDVNVLRLNQSKGYRGAKLSGLQYSLRTVDSRQMPFYSGLRSIID